MNTRMMNNTNSLPSTLSIILGGVLTIVGIVAYVLTDFVSITALIPSVFGLLLLGAGGLGRKPDYSRNATIGIGVLALLGILGSLRAVPDKIALLSGESVDSVVATASQAILIGVCLVLLVSVGWAIVSER